MIEYYVLVLVVGVVVGYGVWRLLTPTTNEDILEALDEVAQDYEEAEARLAELEAKMTAFQTEMWEYVDGTLQPLNKRVATRLRRQKESLSEGEDNELINRPGLISPSQLKKLRDTHGHSGIGRSGGKDIT